MGKKFAAQLKEAKQREFTEGLISGLQLGKILYGIACNNVHGMGQKRIKEAEVEFDRLCREEIEGKEPEVIMAGLQRKINQIR